MWFDGISVRWHSLVLGWIIKVGEVSTVMLHGKKRLFQSREGGDKVAGTVRCAALRAPRSAF
jgi:hypothetical protein